MKYSQENISQFDKNAVSYGAWNVVILSETLDSGLIHSELINTL